MGSSCLAPPEFGLIDGLSVGSGVGLPGLYDGTDVGSAVGADDGLDVGCGVGLPGLYVGVSVGLAVGDLVGECGRWPEGEFS